MKWAFRNKTDEKRPKMAIFKLLVLSYMLTTLYITRLFKYGGRVRKGIVKFCHPLQVAIFSMLLVQYCLRYINSMTFESILGAFLFKTSMFQRIIN